MQVIFGYFITKFLHIGPLISYLKKKNPYSENRHKHKHLIAIEA